MVNRLTVAAMALLLSVACSSPSPSGPGGATQADPNAAAAALAAKRDPNSLMVVDCLLPGQVRKLGSKLTYLTQPRPVKTSGVDCEIRGGEYVALDRATYADSLRVWLPLAEGGDPKAQTFVGEIFEKGLGVSPDYPAAIQ
jgi:TPR repeat protein